MKLFFRIATVLLILALVWAGLQFIRGNETSVEVDYLLSRSELPLWQGLSSAFACGWLGAMVIFGWGWLRSRIETRRYRKAHARLEAEVEELRRQPIIEDSIGETA